MIYFFVLKWNPAPWSYHSHEMGKDPGEIQLGRKKNSENVLCSFQSPVYTWFSVCWWPCCPAITRIFLNGTDAVNPYFVWLAYSWLYDRQRKDWYTSPISIDLTPHTSDCPKAKQNIDRGNPRRHNDSCLIAAIEMNKRVSIVLALHS